MRVQPDTARRWIIISALIVGGVYAYRLLIEGKQNLFTVPEFFTAWGATYFVMSLLPPSVGGPLALTVAAGDVLIQGKSLITDVTSHLPGGTPPKSQNPPSGTNPPQAHHTTSTSHA